MGVELTYTISAVKVEFSVEVACVFPCDFTIAVFSVVLCCALVGVLFLDLEEVAFDLRLMKDFAVAKHYAVGVVVNKGDAFRLR